MEEDRMIYFARLLSAATVMMFVFAGAGLSQTQPQKQTLGSPGPGAAAEWKRECEAKADEKGFKGKKRTAVVAKCVKLGALPPELK
jgi:hypothetical protein